MTAVKILKTRPSLIDRPLKDDRDFWAVHRLLVETYPITPLGFNWDIRRWEGWRFYDENPVFNSRWRDRVHLWHTSDGQLVGAAHPDSRGEVCLQVHPNYRYLETEMLAWAEEHLAIFTGEHQQLDCFVYEYDTFRQDLLSRRGYQRLPSNGVMRRLRFGDEDLSPVVVTGTYLLRTTHPNNLIDCQRIADLLNAAFNRDFHSVMEFYYFTQLAPSFRSDLDLVAVAPDGSFAAYVGIPYDETNACGIFEPVCTHPDHRRKGLAKNLMLEGLRRLKAKGAREVIVGTGDAVPANALYNSLGFTETVKGYVWRKTF